MRESSAATRPRSVDFFLAEVPTTGTPSSFDRAGRSTRIPRRAASSKRFTQTITREVISSV